MDGLVYIYLSSGRFDEAEKLSSYTLEIRKAKFGEDGSETLISLTNLASAYLASGQPEKAEKLYHYRLSIAEKTEKDNIGRLVSMEGLASIFLDNNRMDEAKKLYKDMLRIREAGLGDVHPDTMFNAHIVTLLEKELRNMQKQSTVTLSDKELRDTQKQRIVTGSAKKWLETDKPSITARMEDMRDRRRQARVRLERKHDSPPLTLQQPTKGDEEKMQEKKQQENVGYRFPFSKKPRMPQEEEENPELAGS